MFHGPTWKIEIMTSTDVTVSLVLLFLLILLFYTSYICIPVVRIRPTVGTFCLLSHMYYHPLSHAFSLVFVP